MKRLFTTIDGTVEIYNDRDLRSHVVTRLSEGSNIHLGSVEVVDGREWMEVELDDGSSGYVLGPTARGHTTLGSTSSSAMHTVIEPTDPTQLAPLGGEEPPLITRGNKRNNKPWICPRCNMTVDAPVIAENRKRTCDQGHKVEQPLGFLGGLLAPLSFWVMGATLSHVVGWIWDYPARWILAFTLFGVGVAPFVGLVRGVLNFARGGMARRLASGYLGLVLGTFIVMLPFTLVLFSALQMGASRCTSPDQPYLTPATAERVYRFLLPYGIDFPCTNK